MWISPIPSLSLSLIPSHSMILLTLFLRNVQSVVWIESRTRNDRVQAFSIYTRIYRSKSNGLSPIKTQQSAHFQSTFLLTSIPGETYDIAGRGSIDGRAIWWTCHQAIPKRMLHLIDWRVFPQLNGLHIAIGWELLLWCFVVGSCLLKKRRLLLAPVHHSWDLTIKVGNHSCNVVIQVSCWHVIWVMMTHLFVQSHSALVSLADYFPALSLSLILNIPYGTINKNPAITQLETWVATNKDMSSHLWQTLHEFIRCSLVRS